MSDTFFSKAVPVSEQSHDTTDVFGLIANCMGEWQVL